MKIGLLSDTHDYLDPRLSETFSEVDEIWHAGDDRFILHCCREDLSGTFPFFVPS
jgi:predicted phosphodiesterase